MMPQAEREAVGEAARLARLFGREVAARQRDAEITTRCRRGIGAPRHFHLALARKRARRAGQRALETIEGGLVGQCYLFGAGRKLIT